MRRKVKVWKIIDLSNGKGDVEESKLSRIARILKMSMRTFKKGKSNKQGQPMCKKRA